MSSGSSFGSLPGLPDITNAVSSEAAVSSSVARSVTSESPSGVMVSRPFEVPMVGVAATVAAASRVPVFPMVAAQGRPSAVADAAARPSRPYVPPRNPPSPIILAWNQIQELFRVSTRNPQELRAAMEQQGLSTEGIRITIKPWTGEVTFDQLGPNFWAMQTLHRRLAQISLPPPSKLTWPLLTDQVSQSLSSAPGGGERTAELAATRSTTVRPSWGVPKHPPHQSDRYLDRLTR